MTQAALIQSEAVLRVPLARLRRSPSNPRKHLGDLTELAASIAEVGVLEPLVARAAGDDFELVFGHRRHAAAEKAGTPDVPVIVREYSDDEVLEAQITENSQRENPHPLDEADGYAALVKRGYEPQRIADRIGRPLGYVLQRLKLCGLSKECRKALDDEKILLGVAMLLAKLPTQKLQDEGLQELISYDDGLISVADARKELEENVMRALKSAPFKTDDAMLVPAAGACTNCPKRTGTQTELFSDASSPDLCTDPGCFKSKLDAVWQIRSKAHKAAGGEVLSVKDSDALLGRSYNPGARELRNSYVKLDDTKWTGNKTVKVKALFGKGELPPLTLARDPETGRSVEFVAAKDVDAALRKVAKTPAEKTAARSTVSAAEKRRREKELAVGEAGKRLLGSIVGAVEERTVWKGVELELLQGLALCTRTSVWSEYATKAAKRRGWNKPAEEPKKGRRTESTDFFEERVLKATRAELMGLIVELLVARELPSNNRDEADTGAALICEALGVSFEKELAAVQKERAAKVTAKPPKGKATPAAKAKPKVERK